MRRNPHLESKEAELEKGKFPASSPDASVTSASTPGIGAEGVRVALEEDDVLTAMVGEDRVGTKTLALAEALIDSNDQPGALAEIAKIKPKDATRKIKDFLDTIIKDAFAAKDRDLLKKIYKVVGRKGIRDRRREDRVCRKLDILEKRLVQDELEAYLSSDEIELNKDFFEILRRCQHIDRELIEELYERTGDREELIARSEASSLRLLEKIYYLAIEARFRDEEIIHLQERLLDIERELVEQKLREALDGRDFLSTEELVMQISEKTSIKPGNVMEVVKSLIKHSPNYRAKLTKKAMGKVVADGFFGTWEEYVGKIREDVIVEEAANPAYVKAFLRRGVVRQLNVPVDYTSEAEGEEELDVEYDVDVLAEAGDKTRRFVFGHDHIGEELDVTKLRRERRVLGLDREVKGLEDTEGVPIDEVYEMDPEEFARAEEACGLTFVERLALEREAAVAEAPSR